MNITPPKVPVELTLIDSFADYAKDSIQEDQTILKIKTIGAQCENADLYKIDLRASILENGSFQGCCFEKAGLIDVVFQSCDFSNCSFHGAYIERCRFISCKCIGTDMSGTILKHTVFEDVNLQYSNMNTAKLTNVSFAHVDFSDASLREATLKHFVADGSKFIRNDFAKTLLNGIDFRTCELLAPIVSMPAEELRGITVDLMQAAGLISLWGIHVQ